MLEDGLHTDMCPCLFAETSVRLDGQVVAMTTGFDKSVFLVVETDKCDDEEEEECDGDNDDEEEEEDTNGDQKRWKFGAV